MFSLIRVIATGVLLALAGSALSGLPNPKVLAEAIAIPCPEWAAVAGTCTLTPDATLNPDGVQLTGDGSSGEGVPEPTTPDPDPDPAESVPTEPVEFPPPAPKPVELGGPNVNRCWNDVNAAECAITSDGPPEELVTWSDIASFKATAPVATTEPAGWAIRGLPMNPVAPASVEVISGTLLAYPAEVRFTPTAIEWNYGDGGTRRSPTGGASWAALGLKDFSDTSTSHVYTARGDYTLTASVVLTAEYRFAGAQWRPISGALTLAGPPTTISVKTANTVLVSQSCNQNPRAPGC